PLQRQRKRVLPSSNSSVFRSSRRLIQRNKRFWAQNKKLAKSLEVRKTFLRAFYFAPGRGILHSCKNAILSLSAACSVAASLPLQSVLRRPSATRTIRP